MGMVCGAAAAAATSATAAAAAATAAAAAADVLLCAQGEPLYNWRNVKTAVKAMLHGARAYTTEKLAHFPRLAFTHPFSGDGISIGHRRITLSTCGVVPLIPNVGQELGVLLAVSLHAANDDLRNEVRQRVSDNYKLRYLVTADCSFSWFPSTSSTLYRR